MRKNASPKYRNSCGVTLVEMMIVAVIIGILCAIAIPNFALIRNNTYKNQCITNLRRIAAAKEHWSMETGAADTAVPTAAQLDPYVKEDIWDEDLEKSTTGHNLVCPLDTDKTFTTSYDINAINVKPTCKKQPTTHVLP